MKKIWLSDCTYCVTFDFGKTFKYKEICTVRKDRRSFYQTVNAAVAK